MRTRQTLVFSLSTILTFALVGSAFAEQTTRPRGTMIEVPASPDAETHTSNIIYLNACWGGCTIYKGLDDSRTNRSQILGPSSVTIPQFNAGEAAWNEVVACVRDIYSDFNFVITDQDPGNASHFEAIVAGSPQNAGFDPDTGGVSPFTCGIINNAITYTFAAVYGGSVQDICETVAQETAHAFGLDHELYCPDPMTYLYGCGAKRFRDVDAQCGEKLVRACKCNRPSQNSYQRLLAHFGAGVPTPPSVTITEPVDNAQVQAGFVVRSEISDDNGIDHAELVINGQVRSSLNAPPWIFNAPDDLADGGYQVEVRAYDNQNTPGSGSVFAIIGEPCGGPSDCDGGETCVDGRCVAGPGTPGGLGELCTEGNQCASGTCANDGENYYCTEACSPAKQQCPDGFGCLGTGGDQGVCWPGADDGGGGGGSCAIEPSPGTASYSAPLFLGLALFGFGIVRRRRSLRPLRRARRPRTSQR